jgi:hypothetical protein
MGNEAGEAGAMVMAIKWTLREGDRGCVVFGGKLLDWTGSPG